MSQTYKELYINSDTAKPQQVSHSGAKQKYSIEDNRKETAQLQEMQSSMQPVQKEAKSNNTGLPNHLKSGMENLSGMSLDHVKVHYNSPKPAAVQAHAYAQGSDIHLASGQEKHLPHELGHVVQQAQGRVKPTTSVDGVAVNDNASLEHEATQMGEQALQLSKASVHQNKAIPFFQQNVEASKNLSPIQKVLNVKKKTINLDDNNIKVPIFKLYGEHGVALLTEMIQDEDTYEFVNVNELQDAIGAQCLLDKNEEVPDEELTTGLIKHSKDSKAVDKMKPREQGASSMAACFQIAKKYGVPFFGRAEDISGWSDNAIVQTTQQRGDKSHVLAAMHTDPSLQLILCFDGNFKMASEGDGILESYMPVRSRVCVYHGSPNRIKGAGIKNLTFSTATLKHHAIVDPLTTRKQVKHAMTGDLDFETMALYEEWCETLGFVRSHKNKYVIVSHRDSGHKVPAGRTPSHPELDTGEGGFIQMLNCVGKAGFIPVPMGAPSTKFTMRPNMVQWWLSTPPGLKALGKTKGQIEYGMVRYLAEQYGVRLLAMRSGNTDAMAFAGMETIFIDMATEGLDETEIDEAQLDGPEHASHNRSWRRAAMLETILPGVFHQVFIQHPRPDKPFPKQDAVWDGRFHPEDIAHLQRALEYYFGNAAEQVYNRTERDLSSPVHSRNTKAFHQTVESRTPDSSRGGGYESIGDFVAEIHDEREVQQSSVLSDLNEISLKLENIQTRLRILSEDIARLKAQLEELSREAELLEDL